MERIPENLENLHLRLFLNMRPQPNGALNALLTGVEEAALEFCLKVNTENKFVSRGAVTHKGTVGAGGGTPRTSGFIKRLCIVGRNQTGSWKGRRQAQPQGP